MVQRVSLHRFLALMSRAISFSAAKRIIARRKSASTLFPASERKAIMPSVICDLSGGSVFANPPLPERRRPPAGYTTPCGTTRKLTYVGFIV